MPGGKFRGVSVRRTVTATRLLLPAAAESVVKLDVRGQLVGLRLREIKLRSKIVRLAGQHFQVTRDAALIANLGKFVGAARRFGEKFLLFAVFAVFSVRHQ